MSDMENNVIDMKEATEPKAKPYTLRRLDGNDLWPLLEIAGKVMPDDLMPYVMDVIGKVGTENITKEISKEDFVDELGADVCFRMVTAIIKDIGKVKNEVYAFLTSVSGLNKDEINALGLVAVPKMIWEIFNAEKDFFLQ